MTDRIKISDIPLAEIAKALGGTVEFKESIDHGATVVTAQYSLWFAVDTYRKKLNISFTFPSYQDASGNWQRLSTQDLLTYEERNSGSVTTSIGCAYNKGAQAIAKDVARRLVPQCVELTQRAQKLIADRAEFERARDATGTQLVKQFGYEQAANNREILYARGEGLPRLQVSPKSVRFEAFYCSEASALKILAILKADKSRD
jgi:hypothetical protein